MYNFYNNNNTIEKYRTMIWKNKKKCQSYETEDNEY